MAVPTSTTEGCTLYTPDTIVSVHTNKPLPADTVHKTRLVFWCATCCRSFVTVISAIQHMQGKAHKAKAARSQELEKRKEETGDTNLKCEICEMTFSTAVTALTHSKSKKHLKRKHYKDGDGATTLSKHTEKKDNTATSVTHERKEKEETVDPNLACEICELTFSSAVNALTHFKGKKHLKRTQKKEEKPEEKPSEEKPSDAKKAKIRCEDCDIEFASSTIAIPHFKGKKHAGKVAKKMIEQRERNSARGRGLGQGRGSRGRGRGGFGRGYMGGNNYASNPSFTSNQPFNSGSLPSSEYRAPPLTMSNEYRATPLTMSNYYSPGFNDNNENINNSSNYNNYNNCSKND